MRKVLLLVAIAALLAQAGDACASGFNIYEMGSRATALGGAFTATADDASAVFYNPAGMAFQPDGWQFSLNISPISPTNKFTRAEGQTPILYPGDSTGETKSSWFFPTGAYLTWKKEKWAAGLGFFTPFGLGVEWDSQDTFAGRDVSTNAQIQGLYFSPVVSFQPVPRVAISVGGHAVKSHLKLESIVTANVGTGNDLTNVGDVLIEGGGDWAFGAAAAAMWRPLDALTLGVNYKQGVTNSFSDGEATVAQRLTGSAAVDGLVTQVLGSKLGTQKVTGDLDYPDLLALAVRYDFSEKFMFEADAVWFGWSAFDSVSLVFDDGDVETLKEEYEDVWQYRFGVQYTHTDRLRFMAGYVYDETPQPTRSMSPLLPDANRNDYSFGTTWSSGSGRYDLTAGYMLVEFETRSTNDNFDEFNGSYNSRAHIFTLAYTRRF